MTVAERKRQVDRLAERCYAGLDVATLQHAVLQGLRRLMSIDAAFFATVDPATILFTSVHTEEPLNAATSLFLDNEFGRDDVNKFATLATAGDPVRSLDQATRGEGRDSKRYLDVMAPLQLGDELRAALVSGVDVGECSASTAPTLRPVSMMTRSGSFGVWRRTSPKGCGGRCCSAA
jgi:hypothetical protein